MDVFGCDYDCRTVGESIIKYSIPNDWCAEFTACNDACPTICMQVDQIRRNPSIMALKLRIAENEDDEYAGCIVLTDRKTIAFKVDHITGLVRAIGLHTQSDPRS